MLRIKDIREQQRKKQQECADAIGITLRAWQTYEQGAREPKYEILCKIADYFGVTTDYLLSHDEPNTDPLSIDNLAKQYNLDPLEKQLLERYMSMPEDVRKNFMEFIKRMVAKKENNGSGD